jgi:hypothetical protein
VATLAARPLKQRESGLICWRPQRDLNPCYSLERAVSWAG